MVANVWTILVGALSVAATAVAGVPKRAPARPAFPVPSLTAIRDILSQLEAPIISTLTQRLALATDQSLYNNNGSALLAYIAKRETVAANLGRFDYGSLEYPFTLPPVSPDNNSETAFPPGIFHQDSFVGNANITQFYLTTLVPLLNSPNSYFFHLTNSTLNDDAQLNLDATLLALLSHRAHIGKIVGETKFAGNVSGFTPLINSQDSNSIRVLLTNTTQEVGVLAQAQTAASALSSAWVASGALVSSTFPSDLSNAAALVFRELIDITTEIEVQYILARLS